MSRVQSVIAATTVAACAGLIAAATPAAAQRAKPPAQITIHNMRTAPLTTFEIATTADQPRLVGKLAKPLAPGKTVAVKLSKPAGCSYYVLAKFGDEVESDAEAMDLCKDRIIRLTE